MSNTLNYGSICVPEYQLGEAIDAINGSKFADSVGELTRSDFCIIGNMADYEVNEVYGDIESELEDMIECLAKTDITPEISITFSDAYGDGKYVFENGELVILTQDEVGLRNSSTDDLIAELMRRNGSLAAGDAMAKHLKRGFLVPTPLGMLHAYQSYDPDYPGVLIDITPKDQNFEIGLATIEVTKTEHDLEKGTPHLVGRAWTDPDTEEWTDRVVYKIPVKEDK